jgi:glycosyltransferase involved in cell wall biosynthesis
MAPCKERIVTNPGKLVSIVAPCFNEEENVRELATAIGAEFAKLPGYRHELIFIDNASTDRTVEIIKELAGSDPRVKLIVNVRNFGHIRSPYYGLLQAKGDAVILMASDLQDPPMLIPSMLARWEEGFKVVKCVKNQSDETPLMFMVRKVYYDLVSKLSDVRLTKNFTGFGLYDQVVIETLRRIDDPYPYFRGLISDLGYAAAELTFRQPTRRRGLTKNNFYTLYDIGMLGITNHSKVPLRMATMAGFAMSALSLLVAVGYLLAKLFFWSQFSIGIAPIVIGLFLFSSVQLFFIGIIGEYLGAIHTQVLKRPLVIERERVNLPPAGSETSG